ncbi:MAG: phosphatase PAP2 family protein [Myxococcales bacterium]
MLIFLDRWDHLLVELLYGGERVDAATVLMVALSLVGGGWAMLGLVPLAVSRRTRRFACFVFGVLAVQATLVWGLKASIARVRPWKALGLHPTWTAPQDFSFPSGHATGSFAFASFAAVVLLATRRGGARIGSLALFAVATLVAYSRIHLGAHWPSDVVAGAVLGTLVGTVGARAYLDAV